VRIATDTDWTIGTATLTGELIESMAIRWQERFEGFTGTTLVLEHAETPNCLLCLSEQIVAC
jgi:hypothetical protein